MIKLKKLKTPLRFIGIRRYKSSDGTHWIKFGRGSRKPIHPRWFTAGKWSLILLIVGTFGIGGYRIGFTYISGIMMDHLTEEMFTAEEIAEWKNDPHIQQLLSEHMSTVDQPLPTLDAGSATMSATEEASQTSETKDENPLNSESNETAIIIEGSQKDSTALQSKEQVMKLLLSKFTMAELTGLLDLAKDGLSDKDKEQIKATLLEKLTTEEFEAIKLVALAELAQR